VAQDELLAGRIGELQEARERLSQAMEKVTQCSTCATQPTAENNFCEPCQASGSPLPRSISALF
jgi:recombinational DNA repair protein RecR